MEQLDLVSQPAMISRRWHFHYEGRRFILYADNEKEAVERATAFCGYPFAIAVYESGYYDPKTNMIIAAKDGPTIVDDRSDGRL